MLWRIWHRFHAPVNAHATLPRAPFPAIESLMTEPVAFSDAEQDGQISARPRIVQDFALLSRSLRDIGQLRGLLRDGVWALGFHYFLLQGAGGQIWLADLPQDWVPAEGPSGDAVLATAAQSYAPFLW